MRNRKFRDIKWSPHSYPAGERPKEDIMLDSPLDQYVSTFPTRQPSNNVDTHWKAKLNVFKFPG